VLKAVVFDIGGVLEVNPRTGWQARWAERLGVDVEERLAPVWRGGDVGTVTLEEVERGAARVLGLDPPALRAFMDDLWEEYVGSLNEELARYFAALRPRYRTGILSNSFVGGREREQALYGFEDMCDVLVYSHEEGMRKPEPRIYEIVCRRLGVAPHETVFVDDTPECVEGAARAGLHAIRFVSNTQAIAELDALLVKEG
jgi:putative hydrolase of the HAD superfamily